MAFKEKNLQKRAKIKLFVFGGLTVLFIALSFLGLTMNSQGAKERYDTLIAVDQAGGDVELALNELRAYIYSHMNTQIGSDLGVNPPIQLKGTYDRLVAAEKQKQAQPNDTLYAEAQADCERSQPAGFSGSNRLACIEAYVDANGVTSETPIQIEEDFYKFDFASPRWSADLAGFSILFSTIFGITYIVSIVLYYRTKNMVEL